MIDFVYEIDKEKEKRDLSVEFHSYNGKKMSQEWVERTIREMLVDMGENDNSPQWRMCGNTLINISQEDGEYDITVSTPRLCGYTFDKKNN